MQGVVLHEQNAGVAALEAPDLGAAVGVGEAAPRAFGGGLLRFRALGNVGTDVGFSRKPRARSLLVPVHGLDVLLRPAGRGQGRLADASQVSGVALPTLPGAP